MCIVERLYFLKASDIHFGLLESEGTKEREKLLYLQIIVDHAISAPAFDEVTLAFAVEKVTVRVGRTGKRMILNHGFIWNI